MKTMNLTGLVAAAALAGLVPACATPSAGAPASSPAAAASPSSSAPAAAAAAPASTDPSSTGGTDKGKSAPPQGTDTSSGAGNAKPAAPATPGAATGTISGQITASPAKFGKHVVVWLNAGGLPAKPKTVEIDQKSMKFSPYLTAVPAGSKVVFRNSDPFPHNVFSPDGPNKFNLGMMPAKSARIHVFKNPGPSTLLCQIHPGMIAYVYTVPSKFYAIADSNGHYTIKNVPNGTYKLSAWAPKLAVSTQNVTVAGAAATVSLHLHRGG